ncbi:hypothetical protein e2017b09.tmp0131 [Eimeria tenella]|uniref:Uncharacterized protein n=1 Tax=Eimeria tenella TaxID=5802 RepID=C8TDW2_EIMTE|nr:hypothetical protein e2017b09.tmp0131 [Eimeria tenella]
MGFCTDPGHGLRCGRQTTSPWNQPSKEIPGVLWGLMMTDFGRGSHNAEYTFIA